MDPLGNIKSQRSVILEQVFYLLVCLGIIFFFFFVIVGFLVFWVFWLFWGFFGLFFFVCLFF